jgi:hypothetical protein
LGLFDRFARDEWNIGIVHQTIGDIARYGILQPVQWFPANSWRIFADPFCLMQPDGSVIILAEMLNHWVGKGEIWSARVAVNDEMANARFHRNFSLPVHLSYPGYVRDGPDIYATVESYEAGGLFLWRLDGDRWHYEKTLLPGPVIDGTLYFDGQLWWIFCTFGNDAPDERLYLFYSSTLLGAWTPHPSNPVKTDRASARPAGAFFQVDGKLIRPSQNSSKTYGGSLVLSHVVTLTPKAFVERPFQHIVPPSENYPDGIHTIAAAGEFTIIDGKRWHYGSVNVARAVVAKVFKIYRKHNAGKLLPHAIARAAP